jgi:hypothetical protein
MKHKALRGLLVVLSLVIVFAAGGGQRDGLNLVAQQIRMIGPRQWLGLMAGLAAANVPVIAPRTERVARSLPRRAGLAADSGIGSVSAT